MHIQMPARVSYIIARLLESGFQAYAVGGCIRDSLMGKTPSDWDICTSALPEETLACLEKHNIIQNGMKHGTVTVRYDNENYEITTFRMDGEYRDNRRPESVTFVRSLAEDLSRRDFTVNALAYNDTDGLCDLFDGAEDIRKKCIRCVGNPDQRFHEDALRILRALRFSAVLDFSIEEQTRVSIHRNAHLLRNISAERILSETKKMLTGDNVESVLTEFPDVLAVFIPEIAPMVGFPQKNPHHVYDVWTHTVKVVAAIKPDYVLRLAALYHDIGKPQCHTVDAHGIGHFKGHPDVSAAIADQSLKTLKSDNKTRETVTTLCRLHDIRPAPQPKYVRRLMVRTGAELFDSLLELKRADAKGQNPEMLADKLRQIDEIEQIYRSELQQAPVFRIQDLAVDGNDVIRLGVQNGRQVGECLQRLLRAVIDGELENTPEQLTEAVRKLYPRD